MIVITKIIVKRRHWKKLTRSQLIFSHHFSRRLGSHGHLSRHHQEDRAADPPPQLHRVALRQKQRRRSSNLHLLRCRRKSGEFKLLKASLTVGPKEIKVVIKWCVCLNQPKIGGDGNSPGYWKCCR